MARAAKAAVAPGQSALEWLKQPLAPEGRLYWLNGPEDYLREQVLRRLRQHVLVEGFAEFNHQIVRASAATRGSVLLDALSELPVMVDRRLLELHQVHELPARVADELCGYLQESLNSGLVVAVLSDSSKSKSGLWDFLKQKAQVLSCDMEADRRAEFLAYSCQQLGLELTRTQQQRVLERTGGGLRLMSSALERLALFAGERRSVTDSELDQLVHDSSEVQVWKLTEAIAQRNSNRAYALLHKLLHQEPPQTLLSYLNTYLLGLVQVAELRPRLKTAAAIAKELPRRSEFQIRKSLEELSTWSETDLAHAFERLARADYRIKTGADPVLMMQLLLLGLCHRKVSHR